MRSTARLIEFTAIFLLLPLALAWQGEVMRRYVIPQLLIFAALCLWWLARDPRFDWRALFAWPVAPGRCLRRIAVLLLAGGALLHPLALALDAEPFALAREQPWLWVAVLLFYPLLSALPQELVFRVFFFHRYRTLFPSPAALVCINAAVFALAHLQLGNGVALALSFLGGLLFAYTYLKTRSL
ncbi:MAG: CPBP family intramembrane metalloprotease, partial [Thiobacillaceae bacterium]|nr:CPBP family intramembrane metalloprotease [Thiobacillaceae bacterium]